MTSRPVVHSLVDTSIDLIRQHQASTGAYIAAPEYDTYAYSWLRDGAFIATAMDSHGHHDSATAFHRWVTRAVEHHAHKVERLERNAGEALKGTGDPLQPLHDRYVLHTRFTVDGREGQDHWGNFQLDGYGFWLTSITRHLALTAADPAPYLPAIDLVRRYLSLTWDRPCFDSWEEYSTRRHTTTWAAIAKGLRDSGYLLNDATAVTIADEITTTLVELAMPGDVLPKFVPDAANEEYAIATVPQERTDLAVAGHERVGRPLDSDAIDGSALLVLGQFGPFGDDHPIVSGTLQAVEADLVIDGGVHRYLDDEYYGGGLWIVLAGALACAQAHRNAVRANDTLNWIEAQGDAAGRLAEQSSSRLRNPNSLEPWIRRWGPPAKPLLWSHAMYLLAVVATETTNAD